MSSDHDVGKGIFWLAFLIVGLVCFFAGNCGEPAPKLKRSLEGHGFTNIQVGDWDPWECGDGDTISRRFSATNSKGDRVSGTVCCGYFIKGCTVRW